MKRYNIDSLENRDPERIKVLLEAVGPFLKRYFKPVVNGLEKIPEGAGLFVGNHNSALLSPDSFIFANSLYEREGIEALPYALGHEVVIQAPLFHQLLIPLGAVRASHENAHQIFRRGKKVFVYPGGDLDAFRPFRKRNQVVFGPRRGYIRLALREKVPIIPVVAQGAHSTLLIIHDGQYLAKFLRLDRLLRYQVFPLTLSIPWGLTLGLPLPHLPFPSRIKILVLDPIHFERTDPGAPDDIHYVEECHRLVHERMQSALQSLCSR